MRSLSLSLTRYERAFLPFLLHFFLTKTTERMPPRTATTTTTRGQRALAGAATTTSNKNKRRALSDASNVNSLDATVSASQSKKTKKKPKKKASGSHLQPTHHRDASENVETDDDAKKKTPSVRRTHARIRLGVCVFVVYVLVRSRYGRAFCVRALRSFFRYLFENVFPLFGCRVGEKM